MTEKTIAERAEYMEMRAYDMFPTKDKPDDHVENPFPMYSYERPVRYFWDGFIQGLMEKGLNEAEIEELLRSKHMRWMLDSDSDKLVELGKSMVTDSLVKAAKEMTQ